MAVSKQDAAIGPHVGTTMKRHHVKTASLRTAGEVSGLVESPQLLARISADETVALLFISAELLHTLLQSRDADGDALLELKFDGRAAAICVAAQSGEFQLRIAAWLPDAQVASWLARGVEKGELPVVLVCAEDTRRLILWPLPFARLSAARLATLLAEAVGVETSAYAGHYAEWLQQLANPGNVVVPGLEPATEAATYALATGSEHDITAAIRALAKRLH